MEIQDAVKQVEQNKDDYDELDGTYLCSALSFVDDKDDAKITNWELSYYHPKHKKITQVSVKGEDIEIQATGDPTKPGNIPELDLKHVKISAEVALANSRAIQKAKYMQPIQRIFISLQSDDHKKPFWSVSLISKLLSIVNIKIDAVKGDVIDTNLKSFLQGKSSAQ